MSTKEIYILQLSLNHYFVEINNENKVITSNSPLSAVLFDNIYTGNSFKKLLKKHYDKEFNLVRI